MRYFQTYFVQLLNPRKSDFHFIVVSCF